MRKRTLLGIVSGLLMSSQVSAQSCPPIPSPPELDSGKNPLPFVCGSYKPSEEAELGFYYFVKLGQKIDIDGNCSISDGPFIGSYTKWKELMNNRNYLETRKVRKNNFTFNEENGNLTSDNIGIFCAHFLNSQFGNQKPPLPFPNQKTYSTKVPLDERKGYALFQALGNLMTQSESEFKSGEKRENNKAEFQTSETSRLIARCNEGLDKDGERILSCEGWKSPGEIIGVEFRKKEEN